RAPMVISPLSLHDALPICSDDKSLTIPIAAGWDEDIAVSHLWKYVLEEHGYSVKLPNLDVAPLFVGLADGEADIFFDTWLPNTQDRKSTRLNSSHVSISYA